MRRSTTKQGKQGSHGKCDSELSAYGGGPSVNSVLSLGKAQQENSTASRSLWH